MKILVFSHKQCWQSPNSPIGYATDGGFVYHMEALCSICDGVRVIVPVIKPQNVSGEVCFTSNKVTIVAVKDIPGRGIVRKLLSIPWFLYYLPKFLKEIRAANGVHVPIPSDIGTFGILISHLGSKPLFIRYCGNWLEQKTRMQKLWRWYMEKYAGKNRLFLATGGAQNPPSQKNPAIEWIFSTSLTNQELETNRSARVFEPGKRLVLIIAARQEKGKGTDIAIKALPIIQNQFPHAQLIIVGDGSALPSYKALAEELEISDSVLFTGKVHHDEVIRLMQRADFFCFPTQSEGFPKVALEALSCGLPVITNPVSVLPQLIGDTHSGKLMISGTPEELAEMVCALSADKDAYSKLSENAWRTASEYSLEAWAQFIKTRLDKAWTQT